MSMILERRFGQAGFKVESLNDGFLLLTRLSEKTTPSPDAVVLVDIGDFTYQDAAGKIEGFFLKTDGVENLVAAVQAGMDTGHLTPQ